MKLATVKNLFVRILADGKISIGEYLNAKWHNATTPFKKNDEIAWGIFRENVRAFQRRTGRTVAFISKSPTVPQEIISKLESCKLN